MKDYIRNEHLQADLRSIIYYTIKWAYVAQEYTKIHLTNVYF